jgi:hypothetical protein
MSNDKGQISKKIQISNDTNKEALTLSHLALI